MTSLAVTRNTAFLIILGQTNFFSVEKFKFNFKIMFLSVGWLIGANQVASLWYFPLDVKLKGRTPVDRPPVCNNGAVILTTLADFEHSLLLGPYIFQL